MMWVAGQFLELAKAAQSKQDLRLVLLSLISTMIKHADSPRFYDDLRADIGMYEEIFSVFCEKILQIFTQGDILDCTFLYLAFIAPESSAGDDRFSPFIHSAQKLLDSNLSQEEAIMLAELGAIARVLANPAHQNLSFFTHTKQEIQAKTTIYTDNESKKLAKLDSGDSGGYCDDDGVAFFLANIMQTNIAGTSGMGAGRAAEFLIELFSIPCVGFLYIKSCVDRALSQAKSPIIMRNICNWQLHILWNAKNLFNNPNWLSLYDVWKRTLYDALAGLDRAISQAELETNQNLDSGVFASSAAPSADARVEADSMLELALYLQFFIYHMCGNSFRSQEQWRAFNVEISQYASAQYARYAQAFLPPFPKASTQKSGEREDERIIIGILRDRLVENSPFKVEYSLIKNLLASPEFTQHYEIKIYCMSLLEKSENNPETIAKIAALGIETIDIGLAFNRAEFYNSHLQKALALREIMLKDEVAMLISPNNGYGISDFLLASRCAQIQAFWSHGNYVYDVAGIDARLTHICNNQKHITHRGFSFYGIPVQMDRSFYNPKVPQELIANTRACYVDSSAKQPLYLFGVIGRLVKIDSLPYLEAVCALLERHSNWRFLACGLGNEGEIKQKISQINPQLLPRFFFSGYVDSAVYGHILDFWVDSFPMEQGESRIEYVAKGRGLSLRYYTMSAKELESTLGEQLASTQETIEMIIDECKSTKNSDTKAEQLESTIELARALDSGLFSDFASYRELALGFARETSAFSVAEYVEKATHIMRLCELDSNEYARKVAIQSAIHAMNSEIKARLGVEYFLAFAREHLV